MNKKLIQLNNKNYNDIYRVQYLSVISEAVYDTETERTLNRNKRDADTEAVLRGTTLNLNVLPVN